MNKVIENITKFCAVSAVFGVTGCYTMDQGVIYTAPVTPAPVIATPVITTPIVAPAVVPAWRWGWGWGPHHHHHGRGRW